MASSSLLSVVQAAHDGLMVWKIFFLALFFKHQLVLNITMSSLNLNDPQKVTRSPSHTAPYRCGGMGDFYHDVQPTLAVLSCHYGPESLMNISGTLLNLHHEELRHLCRQKGGPNQY